MDMNPANVFRKPRLTSSFKLYITIAIEFATPDVMTETNSVSSVGGRRKRRRAKER
tara:strand:- start:1500 stop:1667 length:168 start_codon:yes stop_codon:yes gene_type:complete